MENKPKKSKAIIITIILVLLLVLVGYLLFKRAGNSSSSNFFSRIFSSLGTSKNTKTEKVQAGEDIKKGDSVTKAGTASDGSSVVVRSRDGSNILGTANEDIANGGFGEITISDVGTNNFLNSFSGFLNNLFGNDGGNGVGLGTGDGVGITNDGGEITTGGDGEINTGGDDITTPYECSDTIDNDGDEKIDAEDPECHLDGDLEKEYMPNHNSEANAPSSGDLAPADLTAGVINPTNTTTNTLTTISSVISNNGESSTNTSFYSFFTITNTTKSIEEQIENEKTTTTISKSKIKIFLSKIIDKIPWVSSKKTIAEENVELKTWVNPIAGGAKNTASVFYTFGQEGAYYVRACADKSSAGDTGTISESNEDNNCGPWTIITVSDSLPTGGDKPQCSDAIDNDGDEKIDAEDPECHLDGDLEKEYLPEHYSESSTGTYGDMLYECNDTIDNDGDDEIDEKDPNCHLNGDLDNEYIPDHDSESTSPSDGSEKNKCLLIEQNPLTFTDAEKARLEELLRKFYLISSTLRTADDIATIYNEIDQYKSFMNQIDGLSKQCYLEVNDSVGYNDFCARNPSQCSSTDEFNYLYSNPPARRHGNPWYTKSKGGTYPYDANDYSIGSNGEKNYYAYNNYLLLDGNYTIDQNGNYQYLFSNGKGPGCKVVSGYYYGTGKRTTGGGIIGRRGIMGGDLGTNSSEEFDCNIYNTFTSYNDCYQTETRRTGNTSSNPDPAKLEQGCKWQDGVNMEETERILNIW